MEAEASRLPVLLYDPLPESEAFALFDEVAEVESEASELFDDVAEVESEAFALFDDVAEVESEAFLLELRSSEASCVVVWLVSSELVLL